MAITDISVCSSAKTMQIKAMREPDLVNDTAARPPEANAVFGTSTGKEIIDLLVGLHGKFQVCLPTKLVLPVNTFSVSKAADIQDSLV